MMIADTDVLIDFLKGKGAASRIRLELEHRLATTSITAFELWTGAKGRKQEHAIETLLQALVILPLERDSAKMAARVRKELGAKGSGIGMADSLIAGIVIQQRGTLLTRNRKHFERIPALRLGTFD